MRLAVLIICSLLSMSVFAEGKSCQGKFINPITDICWKCLFPISIGSTRVTNSDAPDTPNTGSPVCTCPAPPRVGVKVGFWEPVRMVDVTRTPFCFVSLGGKKMSLGVNVGKTSVKRDKQGMKSSSYHVHWYISPVIYILNLIMDFVCLEASSFDVGYITELDPTWQDDELAFILNPEAIFFANPVAQMACAADCVSTSAGLPLDPLFWCAGCQGSMYPFSGHVSAHTGGVQASLLLAERFTYKLHRMGILWGSIGDNALCAKYPMPIMVKSQYRAQMTYPRPTTKGKYCCNPYGRTTSFWEAGREFPYKGEDFAYMIWRKRRCCAF